MGAPVCNSTLCGERKTKTRKRKNSFIPKHLQLPKGLEWEMRIFSGVSGPACWSHLIKAALVQEQCIAFSLELSSSVSQTHLKISVHVKMGRAPSEELPKGSRSFPQCYLQPKTWAPRALCVGAHHISSLLLSSFPPHQCWFTSSGPYVIHQKEKPRMNDFNRVCARHFAARALTYDQSG